MSTMSLKGYTFSVKRMQTHDGPGFRTTVFMKGCSLRCAWCHNPESLSGKQEVWWHSSKCIGCGACVKVCPTGAVRAGAAGLEIDRAKCTGCMACVEACPSKALEALRTEWTVNSLFALINRDRAFILDGGGVTLSGGEPTAQAPFVKALLQRCQDEGVHTALDTCGAVRPEQFVPLLESCDLVLFDLKLMDPEAHHRWTNQRNEHILQNLKSVAENIRSGANLKLWLRTPLIPGATGVVENIEAISRFIHEELGDTVERWELCAFNNLCVEKYQRLDLEWPFSDMPLLDRPEAETLLERARELSGLLHDAVFLKGRFASEA